MNVLEYAKDVKLSVEEVLKKCKELNIEVNSSTDYLTDDDIIILDNALMKEENLLSEELETKYSFEDRANELIEDTGIDLERAKKVKLKKKDSKNNLEEFKKEKKNIYKHKTKLQKNNDDKPKDIIVYKNDMTVKDLAVSLGVKNEEIVSKLFNLGIILNINSNISYNDAGIICLEYGKDIKKEETVDISNFE